MWQVMYLHGLRFIEAYELKRWQKIRNGFWQLTTAKNGEIRIFDETYLPDLYIDELKTKREFVSDLSYATLLRAFEKYFPLSNAKCGNKRIKTHIFRHLYVLKMIDNGLAPVEIQKEMGHKDIRSTMQYINGIITDY
jgi:integrase